MKENKQQKVADVLTQYTDAYLIGALNAYELAGRLLDAAREFEVDEIGWLMMGQHDCKLDEWGTGDCKFPGHDYELVYDERSQTESEAHHLATS